MGAPGFPAVRSPLVPCVRRPSETRVLCGRLGGCLSKRVSSPGRAAGAKLVARSAPAESVTPPQRPRCSPSLNGRGDVVTLGQHVCPRLPHVRAQGPGSPSPPVTHRHLTPSGRNPKQPTGWTVGRAFCDREAPSPASVGPSHGDRAGGPPGRRRRGRESWALPLPVSDPGPGARAASRERGPEEGRSRAPAPALVEAGPGLGGGQQRAAGAWGQRPPGRCPGGRMGGESLTATHRAVGSQDSRACAGSADPASPSPSPHACRSRSSWG